MFGGAAVAVAHAALPPVAPLLAALTWVPTTALLRVIEWTAQLPWASVTLPLWDFRAVAAYLGWLALLCGSLQFRAQAIPPGTPPAAAPELQAGQWYATPAIGLPALLVCLVCVAWAMASPLEAGFRLPTLALTVPAIQDGSLALVRAPDGARVLLNGGPTTASAVELLGEHLRPWDRTVDVVVLADPRQAHVLGVQHVLERYRVGLLLDGADTYPSAAYRQVRDTAARHGIRRVRAEPGTEVAVGRSLVLEVLLAAASQPEGAAGMEGSEPSDRTAQPLALRLRWEGFSILLPGDQPAGRQNDLLTADHPVASTVLVLTDRASREPAAQALARAADPELIVVQGTPRGPAPPTQLADTLAAGQSPSLYRTVVDGTLRLDATPDGYRLAGQ
jgi:competence protein ComEC